MSNKVLIGLFAIIAIVFGVLFVTSKHTPVPKPKPITASLASLSTSPAPWPAESQHLADRVKVISIPLLGAEGTAQHIHSHLDIYIHGQQLEVPSDIGFAATGGMTGLHSHDATGIMHIESPDASATYTLGQFFDIWGVKLTRTSIGGYANDSNNKLLVYSNGQRVADPVNLKLSKHEEIVITYGTNKESPAIPRSYEFKGGL